MAKFKVVETEHVGTARRRFAVVNEEDRNRPVAHFDQREEAEAHADKLNQGPLDWDEQEQWQDEWEDDWGDRE